VLRSAASRSALLPPASLRAQLRFACLFLLLQVVLLPKARAESALLVGFNAGGAVATGAGDDRARPLFKVGTGVDWLHESGFTLQSRLETTHLIDSSFALLLGWSFEGMRADEGVPLGVSIGGVFSLDTDVIPRAGGRAQLALGLWYSRAVLELDAVIRRRLDNHGDRDLFEPEIIIGLSLRVVPWAPFRL
jgi:hypothetical protein